MKIPERAVVIQLDDTSPIFAEARRSAPSPVPSIPDGENETRESRIERQSHVYTEADHAAGRVPANSAVVLTLNDNSPVVTDSSQPTPNVSTAPVNVSGRGFGSIGLFTIGAAIIVATLILSGIVSTVLALGSKSIVLGVTAAAAVVVGGILCIWSILREVFCYRRMAIMDEIREDIAAVLRKGGKTELLGVLKPVCNRLRIDARSVLAVTKFEREALNIAQSADLMLTFEQHVIAPLDVLARARTGEAIKQAAILVALCPSILVDSLLFGLRAMHLVRSIAEIYGHRPRTLGTILLMRRLVIEAGVIGVGGLAIEVLMQSVSSGIVAFVSTSAAEGMLAGQRMGGIGILTMKLCRPLEFSPGGAPDQIDIIKEALRGTV